MTVRLARLSATHKKDFYLYKNEIEKEGGRTPYSWSDAFDRNFFAYIQRCRDDAAGRNMAKGQVPSAMYWLTDGTRILGEISIRHKLNKRLLYFDGHIGYIIRPSQRRRGYGAQILTLALRKARLLGLGKVLITCDEDNPASRKIIERNEGVYLDSVDHDGKKNNIRRYWIHLS